MKIETTINMKKELLKKLNESAEKTSKSRSIVIIHLLKKIRKNKTLQYSVFSRVSYQEKIPQRDWEIVHVFINPNEYELFLNMRMIYKKSVSWLIAFAIENYLDEVIRNLQGELLRELTDNYLLILKEHEDGIIWHICWELPKKKILETLLN